MRNDYKFINTKYENLFATVSKEDLEDQAMTYLFPMNWERTECYKIDCNRLRSLLDDGTLSYYKGRDYIISKQYGNYFDIISIDTAKALVQA